MGAPCIFDNMSLLNRQFGNSGNDFDLYSDCAPAVKMCGCDDAQSSYGAQLICTAVKMCGSDDAQSSYGAQLICTAVKMCGSDGTHSHFIVLS